jgi:hypothetical protein
MHRVTSRDVHVFVSLWAWWTYFAISSKAMRKMKKCHIMIKVVNQVKCHLIQISRQLLPLGAVSVFVSLFLVCLVSIAPAYIDVTWRSEIDQPSFRRMILLDEYNEYVAQVEHRRVRRGDLRSLSIGYLSGLRKLSIPDNSETVSRREKYNICFDPEGSRLCKLTSLYSIDKVSSL